MAADGSRKVLGLSLRALLIVVVLLFAAVVARWATTSFDDSVHLVQPATLPDGVQPEDLPKAARFHCSAPFADREVTPTEDVAEAVSIQRLEREPCESLWTQRQALAIADGLAAVVALPGVVWLSSRRRRPDPVG